METIGWVDAHQWVVALTIFGLWPIVRWAFFERAKAAQSALAAEVHAISEGQAKLREEIMTVRSQLSIHKAEDAAYHAKADGETAMLRERLASLPTQRDLTNLGSAIERMRVEIGTQLGAVSADVKVTASRIDGVHEILGRTQDAVDRHEQIISEAAHRGRP